MIRVFPRKTTWTPADRLSFVGEPGLFRPEPQPVRISVTFSWDIPEAERLYRSWRRFYDDVELGGPAFGDPGKEFVPGRYVKQGVVFTSRGCPNTCGFCLVPSREGNIRELPIQDGWIVQDNNLLACSSDHIERVFEMLRRQPEPARFSGGLDSRLFNEWHANLLKTIRLKFAWFACDSWGAVEPLAHAAQFLHGFSREVLRCYVLVGYGGESMATAERRLRKVYDLGFLPMASLYRGPEANKRIKSREWSAFMKVWSRPGAYRRLMKGGK